MTIERGEEWGTRLVLPSNAPIASSDRSIAELFTIDASGALHGPELVGLLGVDATTTGGLARTVGARADEATLRDGERSALPIDLAVVRIDGESHVMAGSLVLRRAGWRGVTRAVMNASFLGAWNVAPAGHPNDGRLEVIRAELSLGDRLKARERLPAGTHVPHPGISIRRLKTWSVELESRTRVSLDHRRIGKAGSVDFVVHPDATTIVI